MYVCMYTYMCIQVFKCTIKMDAHLSIKIKNPKIVKFGNASDKTAETSAISLSLKLRF